MNSLRKLNTMSTSPDTIKIDFEKITSTYEVGLVDTLRHFGLDAEFLETWVPDPNVVKSIINLADAAIEANLSAAIELQISRELIDDEVVLDQIVSELRAILDVVLERDDKHSIIILSGFHKHSEKEDDTVDYHVGDKGSKISKSTPHYSQDQVDFKSSTSIEHLYDPQDALVISRRGSLTPRGECCLVRVVNCGISLEVQIDRITNLIEDASFDGDVSTGLEGVLESFCVLIIGLPILEASDHGVARLELLLRGNSLDRPVGGILIPSAVDERFAIIQNLIRKTLSEYRQIAGYLETENNYDSGPGHQWLNYGDQQRRDQLEAVCEHTLEKLGLDATEIEILEIEYDVRVRVRLSGSLARIETDKQKLLMCLENSITEQIDSRLEIFLEPVRDMSTLRRLT